MKLILLFYCLLIYDSCKSQSKLTIANEVYLENVTPLFLRRYCFEVKNETKDTFFINSIYLVNKIPFNIQQYGNSFLSNNTFLNSVNNYPRVIFPNEKFNLKYLYNSTYQDTLSLSGKKLQSNFYIQYHNYKNTKLVIDSSIIYTSSILEKDKIISTSDFNFDFNICLNDDRDIEYAGYLYIKNFYRDYVKLDSISCSGCDSNFNIYGLLKQGKSNPNPKVDLQTMPYYFKGDTNAIVSWYFRPIGEFDKKIYLDYFLTLPDSSKLKLTDSVWVIKKSKPDGFFVNTTKEAISLNLYDSITTKNLIKVSSCSSKVIYLDSITFTDWEKDELQIFNDFELPLKLELGFSYTFDYKFYGKKVGNKRGNLYAHFHYENGDYFYRYAYLGTNVINTTDVSLSKDNPLAFYPNPVNTLATLLLDEEPSVAEQVGIYNSLGILVKTYEVGNKYTQVNTEDFAEGVYIARLLWSGKSVKFCVVR